MIAWTKDPSWFAEVKANIRGSTKFRRCNVLFGLTFAYVLKTIAY